MLLRSASCFENSLTPLSALQLTAEFDLEVFKNSSVNGRLKGWGSFIVNSRQMPWFFVLVPLVSICETSTLMAADSLKIGSYQISWLCRSPPITVSSHCARAGEKALVEQGCVFKTPTKDIFCDVKRSATGRSIDTIDPAWECKAMTRNCYFTLGLEKCGHGTRKVQLSHSDNLLMGLGEVCISQPRDESPQAGSPSLEEGSVVSEGAN